MHAHCEIVAHTQLPVRISRSPLVRLDDLQNSPRQVFDHCDAEQHFAIDSTDRKRCFADSVHHAGIGLFKHLPPRPIGSTSGPVMIRLRTRSITTQDSCRPNAARAVENLTRANARLSANSGTGGVRYRGQEATISSQHRGSSEAAATSVSASSSPNDTPGRPPPLRRSQRQRLEFPSPHGSHDSIPATLRSTHIKPVMRLRIMSIGKVVSHGHLFFERNHSADFTERPNLPDTRVHRDLHRQHRAKYSAGNRAFEVQIGRPPSSPAFDVNSNTIPSRGFFSYTRLFAITSTNSALHRASLMFSKIKTSFVSPSCFGTDTFFQAH